MAGLDEEEGMAASALAPGTFDGKVAIVTGGGSGIGEAAGKELAELGAKVVVTDISRESADRVVGAITTAGGTAASFVQDTSDVASNEAAVQFATDTYGALHLAFNNAGIGGALAPTGEVEADDWNRVLGVNVNGVLFGMRYQIPAMLAAGADQCAIVNMASVHGSVAALGSPAYTASKHAVVGMTRNAAAEYGAQGLRINAVGPGYILTPLLEAHLDDDAQAFLAGKHPLGRLGTSEEIAHVVCFLLSPTASFMTGAYVLIDGGYTVV